MQKKTEEDNFRNSMDLKDENGNVWGAVLYPLPKNLEKGI